MGTEIVTKPAQAVAKTVRRALLDDDAVPTDKLTIPRINILQAMSDAVQEKGEKQGTFYNTVTGENYGDTIVLIPIRPAFGALYMHKEEGLKCKSTDGITSMHGDKCEKCPFGVNYKTWTDGNPPQCQETIDVFCVEADTLNPCILTFRSSSYKAGQRFISQWRLAREASAYRMGGRKDKNDKGTYYTIEPKQTLPLTDEQYEAAMLWKGRFKTTKYEANEE